ncbi:Cellulosome anchoring protein cohesin region [Brevibacillus sp. IT-7CA2]|uniref:hypothetical protein n=1 Tax=Brevibacillus sp. IT-7CA2 TaxID=3026436 RepID=UPI0039E0A4EA
MNKYIFFILTVFLLSGCSGSNTIETPKITTAKVKDVNKKIDVSLKSSITKSVNKVRVSGQTNLPDQTDLMISVKGDNGYFAQNTKKVSNGEFQSDEFSEEGGSLKSGNYTIEISTPTVNVQPLSVQELFGENGENLAGTLVVDDSTFGKKVRVTDSFKIEKTQSQQPSTSYTNEINKPVYTESQLKADPKAPSTNPNDYDQSGQYVPHDGVSKNPADYSINGEYKPVESMTQEEIQAELEQMLNESLGQ